MPSGAHAVHAEIDGIEQRGLTLGDCVHQAALDVLDRGREVVQQFRAIRKGHDEEFVLRVRGLEELDDRVTRAVDLVLHTSAQVKDHTQRDRGILARKVLDLLRDVLFEDLEIVLFQAGHQAVQRVGDGNADEHKIHVNFDRRAVFLEFVSIEATHFLGNGRLFRLVWISARLNVNIFGGSLPYERSRDREQRSSHNDPR
jgi:hypothetical protein